MQKTILMIVTVALVGCGGDPNKKANELFVEAVQLIASGDEQTGEEAIKDYEQGLAKIQTIIDDFSESDLAVKLISGETLFTGKSLKGVKERVREFKDPEPVIYMPTALPPEPPEYFKKSVSYYDGHLDLGPNQRSSLRGLLQEHEATFRIFMQSSPPDNLLAEEMEKNEQAFRQSLRSLLTPEQSRILDNFPRPAWRP